MVAGADRADLRRQIRQPNYPLGQPPPLRSAVHVIPEPIPHPLQDQFRSSQRLPTMTTLRIQ